MESFIKPTKAETVETISLLRGGSSDPVGSFRFSPFPRGETMKRSRCFCEECEGLMAEGLVYGPARVASITDEAARNASALTK
jgi:hypothetical protein